MELHYIVNILMFKPFTANGIKKPMLFMPYFLWYVMLRFFSYCKIPGQYKQTAADRRARPATASKRPDNHLKKYTIYIHCDPERYNEATHVQSRYVGLIFAPVISGSTVV